MNVIPLPVQAAALAGTDAVPAGRDAAPAEAQADISGAFTSPSGRVGRMTGQARLRHIHAKDGQVRATVVFTGRLCDADGSAIGTGSRRATAPVAMADGSHGRAAVIGPVDVDLLGLAVSVRPFVVSADLLPGD